MKDIISFLSIYLYICLLTFFAVKLSGSKFGKCLPFVMISSALVLYLSQFIFLTFKIGFYLLIALTVVSLIVFIINLKDKEYLSKCFSNGLVAFSLIALTFAFIDYNRCFNTYDEFCHWGHFVREMFNTDAFYTSSDTFFFHKEYPPFFSIFELFGCLISGRFSEPVCVFSLHIFSYSLIVSYLSETIKENDWFKKIIKVTLALAVVLLLNLMFDNERVFNSLYVDYSVGMFFAYIFLLIDSESFLFSKLSFLNLLVSLFAFAITKQIAVAYILVLLFYIFVICIKKKNGLIYFVSAACSAFVSLFIWKKYTSQFDLNIQFELDFTEIINDLMSGKVFTINGSNFLYALINKPLTSGLFKLSTPLSIALIMIILVFVCRKHLFKESWKIVLTFSVTIIGYLFLLFVLYSYCFSAYEMSVMASFERYTGSFISALLIVLFSTLFIRLCNTETKYSAYVLLGLVIFTLLFIKPYNLTSLAPQSLMKNPSSKKYRDFAFENSDLVGKKILVLCNDYGYFTLDFYKNSINYGNERYYTDIKDYDYFYCFGGFKNDIVLDFDYEEEVLYKVDKVNRELIKVK